MDFDKLIKHSVRKVSRMEDCLPGRFSTLRFDKNERLLPYTEAEVQAFRDMITSESLSAYMPLSDDYKEVAAYFGVQENQLLLTSGSEMAIKSVYEATLEEGSHVVIPAPGYAMSRIYAQLIGANVTEVPLSGDWGPDLDAMTKAIDGKTKVFVVEDPTGLGQEVNKPRLEQLATELQKRNVLLLIDQAYHYVSHDSLNHKDLIAKFPNVVVSISFSKGHGIAGTRVGCLLGSPQIMDYMRRVRPMHEITSLSALALRWALRDKKMLKAYQDNVRVVKEVLAIGFRELDVPSKPTATNFALAYLPDEGRTKGLSDRLKSQGVLIRPPYRQPTVAAGWSRITIGTEPEAARFLKILKKEIRG